MEMCVVKQNIIFFVLFKEQVILLHFFKLATILMAMEFLWTAKNVMWITEDPPAPH